MKAVIVEHYGFLPPSFETHRIVNLSHRIGLWSQFPPDLRAHLADIAPLDPNVRYSRETRLRDPLRTYETVFTLLRSSILLLGRSVGLWPTRKPAGQVTPMPAPWGSFTPTSSARSSAKPSHMGRLIASRFMISPCVAGDGGG